MAWFLNVYRCDRCKRIWTDEWSCMCDDDCPHCGARHMSPCHSEDMTEFIDAGRRSSSLPSVRRKRRSTIPTIVKSVASRRALKAEEFLAEYEGEEA